MADIFISYAHEDRTIAGELVRSFEDRGWNVWWDRDVPPGREFESTIENALLAAGCIIVLWSRHSVESRWVKNEAREAAELGRFLPVVLDECRIPFAFRGFESVSLQEWPSPTADTELRKLQQTVAAMLARDPDASVTSAARVRDDPTLSVRIADRIAARLDSGGTAWEMRLAFEALLTDTAIMIAAGASRTELFESLVGGLVEAFSAEYAVLLDEVDPSKPIAEFCSDAEARLTHQTRVARKSEAWSVGAQSMSRESDDLWMLYLVSELGYRLCLISRSEFPDQQIGDRVSQLLRLLDLCWSASDT